MGPRTPTGVTPPPGLTGTNLSVRDLMHYFEGFGDNCEFGFIQRRLGAEPLGLFRFSWVGLPEVIQALVSRFEELDDFERLEVYLQGNEYFVRFGNNFNYHTFVFKGQEEPESLRRKQFARNKFLRRNLIESLECAGKIIVRKGQSPTSREEIMPLHAALRAYGPNILLWVVPATEDHVPGSVEVLEDGLLRGYVSAIGVLAPFVDATLDDWVEVCRNAYYLWRGEAPPAAPIGPNLLTSPETHAVSAPRGAGRASVEAVTGHPTFGDEGLVLRHRLGAATDGGAVMVCDVGQGLDPTKSYVVSAFVWLPESFGGRAIAPVFLGRPTIAAQHASLGLRNQWQRIWATARIPESATGLTLALNLNGGGDDVVFTTRWRLEEGEYPSEYLPRCRRPAPPPVAEPECANLLPAAAALGETHWISRADVTSDRSDAVPAFLAGELVLQHLVKAPVDGIVFDRLLNTEIRPAEPLVFSLRVWIPADFSGKAVVPVFVGFSTVKAQAADLSRRDCWQRIWVKAIAPDGQRNCAPALRMTAESGSRLFTSGWKVEQGDTPTSYAPRRRNWIADAGTFAGGGWSSGAGATATPETEVPPPVPGAVVLTHRLVRRTSGNNMAVHQGTIAIDAELEGDFVLSIWLRVPPEFRGLMICPQIDGEPSRALYPAFLSSALRGQWQRIWTQATVRAGMTPLTVRLLTIGEAGDSLQSSCWKLERAHTPGPY
jgi:hypothetical protein